MDAFPINYHEIQAKSILNKSGIGDYTVNCYSGCAHGCVYCYARFVTRFTHPRESWGSFVDIKTNAPQVLAREVKRKPAGSVILSSVCDAWQPVEKNALLTRQCLELLLRYRFNVHTLTKSALSARDLDIMKGGEVDFGVTITSLDEKLSLLLEPGASPLEKRLEALQEAKSKGIRTYAFLGPLLPFLTDTDENLTGLMKAVKDAGADYFYVDKLNLRYGVWPDLSALIKKHYPGLLPEYRKTLFEGEAKAEYLDKFSNRVTTIARKLGMDDKMKL